jgi:hypothetical protein
MAVDMALAADDRSRFVPARSVSKSLETDLGNRDQRTLMAVSVMTNTVCLV